MPLHDYQTENKIPKNSIDSSERHSHDPPENHTFAILHETCKRMCSICGFAIIKMSRIYDGLEYRPFLVCVCNVYSVASCNTVLVNSPNATNILRLLVIVRQFFAISQSLSAPVTNAIISLISCGMDEQMPLSWMEKCNTSFMYFGKSSTITQNAHS